MTNFQQRFSFIEAILLPLSALILFLAGIGEVKANASETWGKRAEREFFHHKKYGEFQNFIENKTYLEVEGSSFIGLQSASTERRTCLYGFFQPDSEKGADISADTLFVCFRRDAYQLILKKEWSIPGTDGSEMDPAGISIGIGNIKVFNPEIAQGPQTQSQHLLDSYPKKVTISVFKTPVSLPDETGDTPPRKLPVIDTNGRVLDWPFEASDFPAR